MNRGVEQGAAVDGRDVEGVDGPEKTETTEGTGRDAAATGRRDGAAVPEPRQAGGEAGDAPTAPVPVPRGKRRTKPENLDREYVRQVLDAALRIGSLMLTSQAGTADVSATMSGITAAYGLDSVQTDITSTTIIVSVPRGVKGAPLTSMFHVVGRSLDFTRLFQTLQLAQAIVDDPPKLDDVHRRIDRIWKEPHPYPRWVSTVALGVMAAAFAVLLGAGPLVAAIALATTAVNDRVGRLLNRYGIPMLFQQMVAGLIATGITITLDAVDWLPKGSAPSLIVASNIMALLSGMAMVSSVQDAITGYQITSVGRLMEIAISTVGIFVGVGAAIRIGVMAHIDVSVTANVSASWLSTPTRVAAGLVGAAAFAVASYAPWRAAVAAGIAGAFGTLTYIAMMHVHGGNVASSFVAAATIGFVGALVAERVRIPMLVVAMSGIVPLVPGFTLYKGFVNMINENTAHGVALLVVAGGTALALAAGVVLGPLLAPTTRRELRKMRKMARELGPRADKRWVRTPSLAGVDFHGRHHMRILRAGRPGRPGAGTDRRRGRRPGGGSLDYRGREPDPPVDGKEGEDMR